MLTFERFTDKASGIDLYDLCLDGEIIELGLDPWTMKTIKRILDRIGKEYNDN